MNEGSNSLLAVVGMTGSGKGIVTTILKEKGFQRVYFGQLTLDEIKHQNLPPGEASERQVREGLRRDYGPGAYAELNLPRIKAALAKGNVVIDGLYSWTEYLILKEKCPQMKVVCVYASPATRKERLALREVRPLRPEEVDARDKAEIENSEKGGPIAIADFTMINEGKTPEELEKELTKWLQTI